MRSKPKLYAYHRSRSKIIEWYMQELGVEYELAPIAMDQKVGQAVSATLTGISRAIAEVGVLQTHLQEHKSLEFLKINPFGKLPVLEMEDGTALMESGT